MSTKNTNIDINKIESNDKLKQKKLRRTPQLNQPKPYRIFIRIFFNQYSTN